MVVVFLPSFHRDSSGNSNLMSRARKELANLFEVGLSQHYMHVYANVVYVCMKLELWSSTISVGGYCACGGRFPATLCP